MEAYAAIEKAIANNDIESLREAIGSICYTSRDFSSGEFDEAVKYVESKGIKLKDNSLTGAPTISSQKKEFTDQDFARAVFELKKNFCDERINDVKTIGKSLYGHKQNQLNNLSASADKTTGARQIVQENQRKADASPAESQKRDTNPNLPGHSHKTIWIIVVCAVAVVILIAVILLLHGRK